VRLLIFKHLISIDWKTGWDQILQVLWFLDIHRLQSGWDTQRKNILKCWYSFCNTGFGFQTFEFIEITYDNYLNLKEVKDFLLSNEFKTNQFSFDLHLNKLRLTALMPSEYCILIRLNFQTCFFRYSNDRLCWRFPIR
jgi:hypothetical protein